MQLTMAGKVLTLMVVCCLASAMRGQATGSFSGNVVDKSGSGVRERPSSPPHRQPA